MARVSYPDLCDMRLPVDDAQVIPNPLDISVVIRVVMDYAGGDVEGSLTWRWDRSGAQYLYVAKVNKAFRDAWGDRPRKTVAMSAGHTRDHLAYCMDHGLPRGVVCQAVARAGNLRLLCWAHYKQGCPWGRTFANAAGGGHLHILKFLHDRTDCPWSWIVARFRSHDGGHMEVFDWLSDKGRRTDLVIHL